MMNIILAALISLLVGCSSQKENKTEISTLEIHETNPDRKSALTKQNLNQLAQVYDLEPFLFTRKINISSRPQPSTTQALSLTTTYAENPKILLSQWLHEEFHYWARLNSKKVIAAIQDLKKKYPKLPSEKRAGDSYSGHAHLIICFLEFEALSFYLGVNEAKSIVTSYIKKDRMLPGVYGLVLKDKASLRQMLRQHQLLPTPLL